MWKEALNDAAAIVIEGAALSAFTYALLWWLGVLM